MWASLDESLSSLPVKQRRSRSLGGLLAEWRWACLGIRIRKLGSCCPYLLRTLGMRCHISGPQPSYQLNGVNNNGHSGLKELLWILWLGMWIFTNVTDKILVTILTGLLNPILEWEDLPVWTFCFLVSGSDYLKRARGSLKAVAYTQKVFFVLSSGFWTVFIVLCWHSTKP